MLAIHLDELFLELGVNVFDVLVSEAYDKEFML